MTSLQQVELPYLKTDRPEFRAGDSVKVHVRVVEGEKERTQLFQGVVIARRGDGTERAMLLLLPFTYRDRSTTPPYQPALPTASRSSCYGISACVKTCVATR